MKTILTIFAFASIFAACKNQSSLEKTKDVVLLSDTLGAYKSNYSTDTASSSQTNALTTGVNNTGVAGATGKAPTKASPSPKPKAKATSSGSGTTANTNTSNGTSGASGNSGTTPATTEKKGWSKSAQGAVIGGVGGAVAGAIISKKKGKGAVIGGVVGAAGGYIIGRGKDKKDGRVK